MSERDSLTTQDDELGARLATLREVTPPPSLVPRVMQRIAVPARDTLWTWLRRPRRFELRMSPLALGGLAVAGLLFFALLARNPRPGQVLSARPTAVLPVVASAWMIPCSTRFAAAAKRVAPWPSLPTAWRGWPVSWAASARRSAATC